MLLIPSMILHQAKYESNAVTQFIDDNVFQS